MAEGVIRGGSISWIYIRTSISPDVEGAGSTYCRYHPICRLLLNSRSSQNGPLTPRMQMKPPSTPPLHILRGLLRQLRPLDSCTSSGSPGPSTSAAARQFVISQYRFTQSIQGTEKKIELSSLASEYFTFRRDIYERSRLHQLDAGAEEQLSPKELSRRAAARAGLQLPDLNPDL